MKKIVFVILIFLFSSCAQIEKADDYITTKTIDNKNKKIVEEIKKEQIEEIDLNKEKIQRNSEKSKIEEIIEIPKSFYIEADFICQAPLQTTENWKYHEESCEEAALLQTINYEKNRKMSKNEAHLEILEMIKWQENNFKGHFDIYADELKKLALDFYNLKDEEIVIIYDASLEDIKKVISMGHPVIAPVTAKYLKNPHYKHPGYHMLQVIGYNESKIITNDNGTRKGKDFAYSNENFEKALKDAGADIIYLKLNQ
jgi:uncharacterized protein YvpB